ncbi:MAG: hypothetical protein HWN81_00920 [Candidatus Lokiarchaeota archaeon]|nr:hypothetical protein [Candidatus Lokiarchaeota archaeon]
MAKSKFILNDLSLITITLIQILIATIISLAFQFLFPFSWQPLDRFLYGIKQHGDPGTNLVFFTISQWYFSLSLACLIFRDNPYINNFLIYSIVPLGIIVFYEFFFLYLYYDYIHITPIFIDIYLIWKKRETLSQKFAFSIITINISWLISVYFLKLAYYSEELPIYIRNFLIYVVLWIILSFVFKSKRKNGLNS